jgi:hypothetical protein
MSQHASGQGKRRWFGRGRTIVRKHYAKIATTREGTGHDQTHAG